MPAERRIAADETGPRGNPPPGRRCRHWAEPSKPAACKPAASRSRLRRWFSASAANQPSSPCRRPAATAFCRFGGVVKVRNWCARATRVDQRRRSACPADLPAGRRERSCRRNRCAGSVRACPATSSAAGARIRRTPGARRPRRRRHRRHAPPAGRREARVLPRRTPCRSGFAASSAPAAWSAARMLPPAHRAAAPSRAGCSADQFRHGAGALDDRQVGIVKRLDQHRLVARFQQAEERRRERLGGTGGDQHLADPDRNPGHSGGGRVRRSRCADPARPRIGGYWLGPLSIASAARRRMASGPSSSGNPWPRLTAPCSTASALIVVKMVVPQRAREAFVGFIGGGGLARGTAACRRLAAVGQKAPEAGRHVNQPSVVAAPTAAAYNIAHAPSSLIRAVIAAAASAASGFACNRHVSGKEKNDCSSIWHEPCFSPGS